MAESPTLIAENAKFLYSNVLLEMKWAQNCEMSINLLIFWWNFENC